MIKKPRYNCNVMREIPKCDVSDTPLFLSNYVTEKNTKDKFNINSTLQSKIKILY